MLDDRTTILAKYPLIFSDAQPASYPRLSKTPVWHIRLEQSIIVPNYLPFFFGLAFFLLSALSIDVFSGKSGKLG
jgi:hypothetical protein